MYKKPCYHYEPMNWFNQKGFHNLKNHRKISKKSCILVFVRAPELGKVKTRLAKVIGNEAALNLYMNFVADELEMLQSQFHDVIVCYYPSVARSQVETWLKGYGYDLMAQSGKDLGERMGNAFEGVFSGGYQYALLIGSDLPDLSSLIILDAFHHLTCKDSVIGPCEDGGYYLIGFRRDTCFKEAFIQIPWGTGQVFNQTLLRFHEKNLTYHTLQKWRDIDTYEDLTLFKKILEKDPTLAKHTYSCIRNLFHQTRH